VNQIDITEVTTNQAERDQDSPCRKAPTNQTKKPAYKQKAILPKSNNQYPRSRSHHRGRIHHVTKMGSMNNGNGC
jgi:hypothetical protein